MCQLLEAGRTTPHRFTNLEWVLEDADLRKAWLGWLESLPAGEAVYFESLVDPMPFILRQLDETADDPSTESLRRRWLRQARRLHVTPKWRPSAELRSRHGDAAYALLWQLSSDDERLALHQFGEEGLLNPGNLGAARSLMHRGLVRRTPGFAFIDDEFERFVKRTKWVDVPQTADAGLTDWNRTRGWLLAGAGILGSLLVLLAPDVLNSSVAVLTAVTGGLPILMRLFGLLGENRHGGAAANT